MEEIIDISQAKDKVLSDMNRFIKGIRESAGEDISSLSHGLVTLRSIRSSVYENLNQIQHEYLILQGLLWFSENGFDQPTIRWYWNPGRQGTERNQTSGLRLTAKPCFGRGDHI